MLVAVLLALCALLLLLLSVLFLTLYVALHRAPSTTSKASLGRSAAVVVLGDIGRSPRMCFHVESLANEGWKVAVVGYKGTVPPSPLRRPSIRHHHLRTPPAWIGRLPRASFALVAPLKVLLQSVSLFWELAANVQPPPEIVLVQTPPALPTLFVVRLVCSLLGSRVIIDWHNLGYTILALRMGQKSPLVRLAETLERLTGQKAFAHLFVTNAMMKHLDRHWGLQGRKAVLHDRPPAHFRRSTTQEVHELMSRLVPQITPSLEDFYPSYRLPESTPFTRLSSSDPSLDRPTSAGLRPDSPAPGSSGRAEASSASSGPGAYLRDDRPALVVSSTSWTADEDFTLLLTAARIYERRARELASTRSNPPSDSIESSPSKGTPGDSFGKLSSPVSEQPQGLSLDGEVTRTSKERRRPSLGALRSATLPNEPATSLPRMLIVVTGKGELKASYEAEIARLEADERWEWVRIRTAWLSAEDYPVLLGSADVGVSLHSSSSGIDLPMKVVDMLGCGLPVCALDFACLDELVHDGHNGVVFRDAEGLARQLESLLALHPSPNWLLNGAGMQNPFEPPSTSSANASPRLSGGAWGGVPTPPSPHVSFTLLNSPGLRPSSAGGWPRSHPQPPQRKSRTATWTGNWKAVVRPLLQAADAERERERDRRNNRRVTDISSGSDVRRRRLPASSKAAGASDDDDETISERSALLHRQDGHQSDGEHAAFPASTLSRHTPPRLRLPDSISYDSHPHNDSLVRSPSTSTTFDDDSTQQGTERAGEEFQSPVEALGFAGGEDAGSLAATRLRQRVSVRQTSSARESGHPTAVDERARTDIPHIQVSHAAGSEEAS